MSGQFLIQSTTCPMDSPSVAPVFEQHTDNVMRAHFLPLDHPTRWWHREHIMPDLAEDAAGVWHLTCCQVLERETRESMFKPDDWQYDGLVIQYHECGDSRPTNDMRKMCQQSVLANAGLTLIGARGPIDEMLAGTWNIGDRDFRAYIEERLNA
jgi:hypothetical protein